MTGFETDLRALCTHVCNGLIGLHLADPTCRVFLRVRGHAVSGQYFFHSGEKLRRATQRATPEDVALGGLLAAAGVEWEQRNTDLWATTFVTDVQDTPSAHARLLGVERTLPLLTALGWRHGDRLASIAPAARTLNPDVAWRTPEDADSPW
jgi:hypothetical protein